MQGWSPDREAELSNGKGFPAQLSKARAHVPFGFTHPRKRAAPEMGRPASSFYKCLFFSHDLFVLPQNGGNLGPGSGALGVQLSAVAAGEEALTHGPVDGLLSPGGDGAPI